MLIELFHKTWDPPHLYPAQEKAIRSMVQRDGILRCTTRFMRLPTPWVLSSGVTPKECFEFWFYGLAYLAAIAASFVFGLLAIVTGDFEQWRAVASALLAAAVGLGAVGAIACVLFFGNMISIAVRYTLWLRKVAGVKRGEVT